MLAPRPLILASLLGLVAIPRAAVAGADPSEALFEQGIQGMEAGRYDEACPAIEQSYRIDPRPGTLFALAECEAKRGRIATAVARYDEYLAGYPKLSRDKKAKQGVRPQVARRQKSLLEPQIPQLTLVLSPDAPGEVVVQCDGAKVAKESLGTPLALDPGEHVITTWVPGEGLSELRAKLSKGEKLLLRLTLAKKTIEPSKPAPAPMALAPTPESHASEGTGASPARRVGVFVAGGVGLVGVVIGGLMGGFAIAEKGKVDAKCRPTADPSTLSCSHEGIEASENLNRFAFWSTIGFAAGAAGSVATVVLIATEPQKGKRPSEASGRLMTAGLLSAGPGGAIFGVKGAW